MIRAILIDDEPNCVKSLAYDLEKYCPDVQIVEKCMSAKDGMLAIRQLQPDLVFLDINMPWMSGIEMLEVLGDINFEVVFTTAHDKYAVQAFRLSAIDYLLKPVDYQDLIVAIARVSEKRNHISPEHLSSLKENLSPATQPQRIGVSTQDGVDFILIQDILYCEADSNYTYIHLKNGQKLLNARTLKEYDQMLSELDFCRIHQTYLINLNHLEKYFRGDGGYVKMTNGVSLNVSRAKKEELLSKMNMQ